MTPLIKCCGLRRPEDIGLVNRYRPEYAGFVLAPGRRCVSVEEAARLAGALAPGIGKAGVFVNAPPEALSQAVSRLRLDIVQLHGEEDDRYIRKIRRLLPGTVLWKAFRVRSHTVQTAMADLKSAADTAADMPLLDTWQPGAQGGTGCRFDWRLLAEFPRPFVLAGGLNADNIAEALSWHPACVDVSSGIECDGWKDENRMRAFIIRVRKGYDA